MSISLRLGAVNFERQAFVYLNVDDPVCAWASVRGVLVSASAASSDRAFISVSTASLLKEGRETRLNNELVIEKVRQERYPHRLSRFMALFCFVDLDSACSIEHWGGHFSGDNIVEGRLIATRMDVLDSNWITYAPVIDGLIAPSDREWIDSYWSGIAHPEHTPAWETLAAGRFFIFGTDLRQRAVQRVQEEFPDSLGILEIARAAAMVRSDLGNVIAYLKREDDEFICNFLMDMRDADNSEFLEKLTPDLIVNQHMLAPHMRRDTFGRVPDLRPYGFRRPIN